eukprot:m.29742 g.29742  ORF g.29742 m.29742 type:complete len:134 (-) comp11972_c0_seq1:161-562(-)
MMAQQNGERVVDLWADSDDEETEPFTWLQLRKPGKIRVGDEYQAALPSSHANQTATAPKSTGAQSLPSTASTTAHKTAPTSDNNVVHNAADIRAAQAMSELFRGDTAPNVAKRDGAASTTQQSQPPKSAKLEP